MTVGNEGHPTDESSGFKPRDFTVFWKCPDTGFFLVAIGILCGVWMSMKMQEWLQKQLKLLKLGLKLRGPPALPFIGNALQFACSPEEILDRIVDLCKHYDSPFRFWLGPKLFVILTKPCDIEVILGSPKAAYKGLVYRFFQPFIGRGLISGSGPTQRTHRKLIMPMLNAKVLDEYVEYFVHHSEYCVNRLEELVDTEEFDIYPFLEHCTIDIILDTIMGASGTSQQGGYQQLAEASRKIYDLVYPRMTKLWLHPDWIYGWTDYGEQTVTAAEIVHSFTESLIVRKRKEHHALERGSVLASRPRLMLLEQLIAHVEKTSVMNDEKLRDEIYTVFLAAQDTSAVISSFVFLMLGMHQSIQDKVRTELHEVLGEGSVTAENIHDLKYVEMVVKETLRLFPIAPLMVRELKGDVDLQTMTLLEGCSVIMVPYMTHRDPNHWANPDEFDPDRFASENSVGRHSCAYVPFSGGLRGCIGQKYAIMCLKTLVANVVRRFRLSCRKSLHELRLKTDISIRSIDGYKVSITHA
ncbi:cytochrome P450 4C1-like [Neodiprion lecontei]|uniref:Cytochrome P450 4C1-like n=1 Tax=Neodiprion lecontei TaxID=441921 RepID=A0A6J0BUC9_NEOLC|nr:cytochrome P450 4C1-like [Neodiprion lecontei]